MTLCQLDQIILGDVIIAIACGLIGFLCGWELAQSRMTGIGQKDVHQPDDKDDHNGHLTNLQEGLRRVDERNRPVKQAAEQAGNKNSNQQT